MMNEIGSINSGQGGVTRVEPGLFARSSSVPDASPTADVAPQVVPPQSIVLVHGKIRESQEEMNQSAQVVRKINDSLGMAKDVLVEMKEALISIRKQYPPYAVDDPRRQAILNAVSGLKKQIHALTIPPLRQESASTAIPYTDVDRVVSIRLHDAMAWDVPSLDPEQASDAEVAEVSQWLDGAMGQINDAIAGTWRDVEQFLGGMTPHDAEQQSSDVRNSLVSSGNRGGIADDPVFLNNVLGH